MHSPAVFLLSVMLAAAQAQDCSQGFKAGAENHVTVGFKSQNRRGRVTTDVTEAEVTWKPQEMLHDLSCYDMEETVLFYKTEGEDWKNTESRQLSAGPSAKWLVPIVPCLKYTFAIKVSGQEEAMFEIPESLGPAAPEEIAKSRSFILDMPENLQADVLANMATLRWSPSFCAKQYDVTFKGVDSDNFRYETSNEASFVLGELEPCTNYEVVVNAVLDDKYSSDLVSNFATKPRLDAASNLEVTVKTTMDSAAISWDAWKEVSCIKEYQLTICSVSSLEEQCFPTVVVEKVTGLPTVSYTALELSPCTDYNLEIQPVYTGAEVESKMVSFRTLSPSANAIAVGQVKATPASSGSMELQWPTVQCAANYIVYQKDTDNQEWKQVAEGGETRLTVNNLTPCTELQFAVSAVLDGQETEQSISDTVMSPLDENDPFEAPNLDVGNGDRSAVLEWDHADCIDSYVLKVCEPAYVDCTQIEVQPTQGLKKVSHVIEGLEPCTQYSLEVIPVIPGKIFTARPKDFTTTNGTPEAPQNFRAELRNGNMAALEWDQVQCSTGYKVYHKIGDPQAYEVPKSTQALKEEYEALIPCQTYYYSISTMVDEQESKRTEWQSLQVPPNVAVPPNLKILSNENDNITLRVEPDTLNTKCAAERVELSYSATGARPYLSKLIDSDLVNSGSDIVLGFAGASGPSFIVQAKIRYEGSTSWSEIASSRAPGDLSRIHQIPSEDTATLIPIVVGVIIAVLLVVLVVVFVLRKRRARDNYDAEKAGENGKIEEAQKLNENHPDA